MKDNTIRNHAKNGSAIQYIYKENTDPVAGLYKYIAVTSIVYKNKRTERSFSIWDTTLEAAEKKLEKIRVEVAFEVMKWQWKIYK